MTYPKLIRPKNTFSDSVTTLRTIEENKNLIDEMLLEKMSITNLTQLLSANTKVDEEENIRYRCTISSKTLKQRCRDTNFISKSQKGFKLKRKEKQRCSDTNFVLKDQREREQKRKENRRSSDTFMPRSTGNSIGNMFNYAMNALKNNITKEVQDEYKDDDCNRRNDKELKEITSEESNRLNDFRNKMIKERLCTHAAILEFLRKEKINDELLKQQQKSHKQQDESICSRFINSLTSKMEPENKTKNNGFDSHETFLSRATKQSMLSKEDAMFIHDSFRQRKMLQRGSDVEYLYDNMSDKWNMNSNNDGRIGDDDCSSASDVSCYVMSIIEASHLGQGKNGFDKKNKNIALV